MLPFSKGLERHRLANTDLSVSIIGLGWYGLSGAYGPADDAESIATIHRALDLGVGTAHGAETRATEAQWRSCPPVRVS